MLLLSCDRRTMAYVVVCEGKELTVMAAPEEKKNSTDGQYVSKLFKFNKLWCHLEYFTANLMKY